MFSPQLVKIRPSRIGRVCIVTLAVIAFLALMASDLSSSALSLLSSVLLGLLFWCWPRYISLGHPQSPIALNWHLDDKRLAVQLRDGTWVQVTALKGRVISALVVGAELHLDRPGAPLKLLLWRDSVNTESYRRLQVALRFTAPLNATQN